MALDFPTSPALNQVYTFGSYSWRWDGTSWVGAVPIVNATINNTTIGAVTPSTGAFTSLTSTSGAFNGTVGATTPSTGAFTTLSASTSGSFSGTGLPYLANSLMIRNSGSSDSQLWALGANASTSGTLTFVLARSDGTSTNTVGTFTSTGLNSTAIGATTPSTVAATTISASGTATSNQIILSGTTASFPTGSLAVGAVNGVTLIGKAGSSFDFAITNSSGLNVLTNPTGTQNAQVAGTLTIGGASPPTVGVLNSVGTLGFASSDNTNSSLYIRHGSGGSIIGTDSGGILRIAANGNTASQVVATISSTGVAVSGTLSCTGILSGPGFRASKTTATSGLVKIQDEGANVYNVIGSRNNADSAALPLVFQGSNFDFAGAVAVTGALSSTTGANFATSSGNVGVGTTNPSNKFVVSNAGAAGLEIAPTGTASNPTILSYNRTTSAYGQLTLASDFLVFLTNGTSERLRIDSSGNVGIGTASPGSKLDVNGEIRIGNTVNTVTATLPNRTITMVIGGTTYYIHAKTTND